MKRFLTYRRQQGFTLFYAVLISAAVLSIGMSAFNLSLKYVQLSAAVRDSQFAFYAADSGAECALYWDLKFAAFATGTSTQAISCNGQAFTVGGGSVSTINAIDFPPDPYCAVVQVTKTATSTVIESRGYNSCDEKLERRVERGILIRY